MKALQRNLVLLTLLFASAKASAQCGTSSSSLTYDTTVTGTGSDLYTFAFPRFDATMGTLTDVNVTGIITRSYGFELENSGPVVATNYRARFMSSDEITSSAIMTDPDEPNPFRNDYQRTYGPYVLPASNGVYGSGPDYLLRTPQVVMNQVEFGATLYNTADFMGIGQLEFNYLSESGVYTSGQGGSASVDYRNGIVQDELTFRITYNYCPVAILAADITTFTARKANQGAIDINWLTKNEKHNRKYELQKSTDGRVFRSVTEFAAQAGTTTGSYRYSYQAQPDENNKVLYFRLKLKENNGQSKLSGVRAVKASAQAVEQPMLYPNPAKGATTLLLSNTKRSNWEVEVAMLSGQVVKRYFFNNAQVARLNENNELKRGLYIIRSINKTTQEQFVHRLLVQ
jgi:hypothetical protein